MNKIDKINIIEGSKALFFAIEPDETNMEYKLWLMNDEGISIEQEKQCSGCGINRMFAYFYYLNNEDHEWANIQVRKSYLVNR